MILTNTPFQIATLTSELLQARCCLQSWVAIYVLGEGEGGSVSDLRHKEVGAQPNKFENHWTTGIFSAKLNMGVKRNRRRKAKTILASSYYLDTNLSTLIVQQASVQLL